MPEPPRRNTIEPVLRFDDPLFRRPERVLVAGVSGVGKTTLAAQIADTIDAPHTEIDGLFHGEDWIPRDEFLDDVRALVAQPRWTTEWQYSLARPLLTSRADLFVWLDLPFATVTLPRVVRRTVRRRLSREELWNGNVEPPLGTFFTNREHIVRWSFATRRKYVDRVPAVEEANPDLAVVRLRTQREVDAWLAGPLADIAR